MELEAVKKRHQEELEEERHKSEAERAKMEELKRKRAEADQQLRDLEATLVCDHIDI